MWLNWFKNRDLLTISFQRYSTVSNWKPLETQTSSLLPTIPEKKNPKKSFQKVKIEKFLTELKKKNKKKAKKKKAQKKERHEHKMSTNHHFQKTLVLRNSTPLTF